jgi:hypothetical protein
MTEKLLHSDWLPIQLPNDLKLLKIMLALELDMRTGEDMTGPIERKIAKLEKQQEKK